MNALQRNRDFLLFESWNEHFTIPLLFALELMREQGTRSRTVDEPHALQGEGSSDGVFVQYIGEAN